MKKNKITVSIGIPAYNEAANIEYLLKALLKQKLQGIILDKIIVVSDASTDKTIQKVKSFKSNKIIIIENKKRLGKSISENIIIKESKADILIMLDADVLPLGKDFITYITAPIINDSSVGIVAADNKPLRANTFVEKIIADSHVFKIKLYNKINNGNNIYLCFGRALAFSKRFYKSFRLPNDCPEDSYSYLKCIKNGFNFVHTSNAKIAFRSPANLYDHFMQSSRFFEGHKKLTKWFDKSFVDKESKFPITILITTYSEFLFSNPLSAIGFSLLILYIKLFKPIKDINHSRWNISKTSKVLYK